MINVRLIILAGVSVAAITSGAAVQEAAAQTPTADDVPTSAEDASGQGAGLEDIVVTARRRIESVQDVPIAVTALSRDDLERRNLTSLESVAAAVPQLTIARTFGGSGAQITLRGVGSASTTSIGVEQSVAVVVDSVYYGQGRIINEGTFDLAGLEVLKGPQSLYYGKNATAGVISINTAGPGDNPETILRAGYEFNAKQVYGEAVISRPMSDTFGIRLALRGSKQFGDLFTNLAADQNITSTDFATGASTVYLAKAGPSGPREKQFIGRLTLAWRPTDQLTATLKAGGSTYDSNNNVYNTVIFACQTGVSSLNPSVPCRRNFVIRQNALPAAFGAVTPYAKPDGSPYNAYRSWNVTGNVEYALDPLTWTTVVNYNWNRNEDAGDLDAQSFGGSAFFATSHTTYHSFSAESRVQTTLEGPLNALAGIYYQSTERDYFQTNTLATLNNSAAPAGLRHTSFAKESATSGETLSLYGQVTLKILPELELSAGGRYIHETKDSFFIHPYADPRLTAGFPGAGPRYVVNTRAVSNQVFNDFSPEATLTWKPSEALTVYAAYKSAYKSGGFSNSGAYTPSAAGTPPLAFDPETVRGGEAGIKSTLFDRQLRLNVAAYSYRYKDFQIDFANGLTFALVTANAGSVKQDGIELDFEAAPRALSNWRLRGSANYNRARFGTFVLPCYVGETPAQGCTLSTPSIPFAQDGARRTLNSAPRWVGSLGTTFTTDIGGDWNLEMAVDGRYSGSYLASTLLTPLSYQPNYVTLDATARLTNQNGWQFALIGRNLTNRAIVNGALDGTFTGSGTGTAAGRQADQRGFIGAPRTVALQASYKF